MKIKKIVLGLFALGSLFATFETAIATKVSVNPNNPIVASNDFFIPKKPSTVDPNQAKISISGIADYELMEEEGSKIYASFQSEYEAFRLNLKKRSDWDKLKISINHGKVAKYQGKNMNVTIEYYDFVKSSKAPNQDYLSISKNIFSGFAYSGASVFKVKLIVTDDSGQEISLDNSFLGFGSLNPTGATDSFGKRSEGVGYNKIDINNYYVTTDTLLEEVTNPITGTGKIIVGKQEGNVDTDNWNSNCDKLGVEEYTRTTVSFQLSGTDNVFTMYSARAEEGGGTWNSMTTATLFSVQPEKPTKKVLNESLHDINGQEVLSNQTLIYSIQQKVNTLGQDLNERYTTFEIEDTLDNNVNYVGAKLVDKDNKEVDSKGSYIYDKTTNVLTYKASKEFLSTMTLDGEMYCLLVTVKVKSNLTEKITIVNKANSLINTTKNETNEVKNPVRIPVIPTPVKRVIYSKGSDLNNKIVFQGDVLIYEISQKVNTLGSDTGSKYTSFEIKDELPKLVSYQSAKLLKDGKELSVETISYDEKTHTVYFKADSIFLNEMTMNGETYTLQIHTKVIKEIGESQAIENSAVGSINNEEKETNKVVNTTKLPKGSITIHKVTKQVVGIETNIENVSPKQLGFVNSFGFTEAFAAEDDAADNKLIWEKLPQKDVTYQVTADKDIVLPNGEIVAEQNKDFGKITTDETGKATIENLYAGDYKFVEVAAPVGIQVDPTPIIAPLTAENNGKEMTATGNQEDPLQEVEISINKVFENENGEFEKDSGAVFGLYHAKDYVINDENTIAADTFISKIDIDKGVGTFQGSLIPNQQYYIKEISTNEKYQLNTTEFVFIYVPVSNDAVHEIEFYENGYLDAGVFKKYGTRQTEVQEKEKDSSETSKSIETVNSTEETSNSSEIDGSESENVEQAEIPELFEIKNRLIHDDTIAKSILKDNDTRVEHYDILKDKEKISFEGQIYIGDHDVIKELKFSDVLPVSFTPDTMKVFDELGNDITKETDYEVDGQHVSIIIKKDFAATLRRTKLKWIVETTYNYSEEHEGKTFENQMLLTINGEELESNIVTLIPPVIEENTVIKPKGSLPSTGEMIGYGSVIGGAVVLLAVTLWYTRKVKQSEETGRTE